MRIDIVIPAYNESSIIADSIREIRKATAVFGSECHIIVADNGSTDGTGERAREAGADVLSVPVRGKGAALIHAARASTAPFFAFIDADLSASPSELLRLSSTLDQSGADIAIGSRLADSSLVNRSVLRTATSELFNAFVRLTLGIRVRDTQCGLKLMNEKGRTILASCTETGWFLDLEFLARANRANLSVVEVPIVWEEFRFPDRQSKLRLIRDSIGAVFAILRIRRTLS